MPLSCLFIPLSRAALLAPKPALASLKSPRPPNSLRDELVCCAGSLTFRIFVRQATMPRRIACSAGVRIPSERRGLRLL